MFIALFTIIAITDETLLTFYGFALIVLHELGHILVSIILKMRISEINFGVASIDICKPSDYETRKCSEKVVLILGGCILNVVVASVSWCLYLCTKNLNCLYIAVQSVGIAILNMLPVESLDGGELLSLFAEMNSKSFESSVKVCNFISWIFLFLLAILGFFIIIKFRCGFSVIPLVFYLVYQKYI